MTDLLLPDQILAQARRRPDAIAVRQWSQQCSYRALLERAGALAARLRQLGVGPEVPVGICMRRTPASVAAILGVGLSGGAYLFLDLSHPPSRNRELAADAGLALLIVDGAGRDHLAGAVPDRQLVELPGTAVPLAAIPPCPATPDCVFQLFYTSGSTGRPKGVLTTHHNTASFVAPCGGWSGGAGPDMRALGFYSFGFDAATYDLFVPLTEGGSIQLVGEHDRSDPVRLQRFIAAHRVTWTVTTPAVLALLDPDQLPELAVLMVGGEVVPPELVEPWTAGGRRRMFNVYGPTEATVCSLGIQLAGRWTVPLPIGHALPNDLAYLLDRHGDPPPAGQPGELYLGGPEVARGYLGRPGLTAERFLPDPFTGRPGGRMYRTGDLARRRPDGAFDYLGRRDGQIQVRGQRVELGEVEAALRTHPEVSEAAVVAVDEHDLDTSLVAFVTPETAPDQPELRSYAAQRLTPAMLPRFVTRLGRLPVAPTGKVDRAQLRTLAAGLVRESIPAGADAADAADGTDGTDRLAALWHRVLGGPAPAPEDDFFDRGGHSIAAMQLVATIRREFRVEFSAEDVFAARTLTGLRHRVGAAPPIRGPALTAGNPPTLSPSQRRLWFLDRLVPGGTAYNVGFAERLRGPLDPARLQAALGAVADRQDVLRWRIVEQQGEPVPVCDPPSRPELPVVDLAEAELPAAVARVAGQVFDLASGPLWTARLFRLGPADHVLALAFHHAIVDGWSQAPLYADLARAYAGQELPQPPFRYADYASWRGRRDRDRAGADRDWWARRLRGAPTVLDLPRDRPRPAVQTYRGELVSTTLPEPVEAGVAALAREVGGTPAMVVLAGLARGFGQLTGASELVIGALAADRGQAGVAELVGFFVDIVPLRLPVPATADFRTAVRASRDAYLAAIGHPGVPLDQIVDALGLPRDPSRPPLVQVMFNVYNFAEPRLELPGLVAEPVPVPVPGSPFDLTVYLLRRDGRAVLEFVYNPDLFDRPRMAALATGVRDLIAELVAEPDRPVEQAQTRFRTDGVTGAALADHPPPAAGPPGGDPLPATPTEQLVAQVWRAVLARDEVRAIDNFFDVGGTSMAAVAVQTRLVELLGRPVAVVDLFRYPSIRAFAAHLDGTGSPTALDRAARIAAARRQRTRRPQ